MRIGIDARMYGAKHTGGIGRYLETILTGLAKENDGNTYVIFLRQGNFHEAPNAPHFEKHLTDIPLYSLAEQTKFAREVKYARVDLMHYPHWNMPILCRTPFVVTIHDTILLNDPHSARTTTRGPLVHGVKYLGFRLAIEHAVFSAKKIIAVSEAGKADIRRHFRVDQQKIKVIHNIVHTPKALPNGTREKRDILPKRPFVLYVGSAYPHKNLPLLLRAFHRVQEALPEAELLIAGPNSIFLQKLLTDPRHRHLHLSFCSAPSDTELAMLYTQCAALVFPSLHEGFGLPPCEALLAGANAIVADIPVLHEVCGDAAYYAKPTDERAWTTLMLQALRGQLVKRANIHTRELLAKKYATKPLIEQLRTVYASAAPHLSPRS